MKKIYETKNRTRVLLEIEPIPEEYVPWTPTDIVVACVAFLLVICAIIAAMNGSV